MKRILLSLFALGALSLGAFSQTTFDYTGGVQTYTVPAGVTAVQIECYGAEGGSSIVGFGFGGLGGYVTGEFTVTPGEDLYIYVGGEGDDAGPGGYNGGGNGVFNPGGGGGSDVRQGGTALTDRIIVAGGGGGGSHETAWSSGWGDGVGTGDGGDGGGLTGEQGESWQSSCQGGTGGTSTAGGDGGGALGVGGDGAASPGDTGGGGGGYYGGGGGGFCTGYNGAGGGGSSYADAGAGAVTHTQGVQTGNGQIIITPLCEGLTYTVSDDTVCVGDEVILDATSTLGGTITWDGGVTNGVAFTPPLGTTTYNATSSDGGDCGLSITIFVGEIPTVDAGLDQDVCDGDSTMVTASGTATDYSWDGGVTDGVYFTPTGTTTLTVTGTIDSTGCETTDMVEITVVVPDVSITATGSTLMSNQAGADSYQWIDCHDMSPIAGETSQSYTPSADGDYAVIVTVSGCTDTSACQASYVGIEDLQKGSKPHVYPNPTDSKVIVYAKGTFTYQLMSLKGDIILQGEGEGSEELNMEELSAGAYIINVITEFGVQPVKVMKR